jgi:hypothetical protein
MTGSAAPCAAAVAGTKYPSAQAIEIDNANGAAVQGMLLIRCMRTLPVRCFVDLHSSALPSTAVEFGVLPLLQTQDGSNDALPDHAFERW